MMDAIGRENGISPRLSPPDCCISGNTHRGYTYPSGVHRVGGGEGVEVHQQCKNRWKSRYSKNNRLRTCGPRIWCWRPQERAANQHIHPRGKYRHWMQQGRLAEGLSGSIGQKVASGSAIVSCNGGMRKNSTHFLFLRGTFSDPTSQQPLKDSFTPRQEEISSIISTLFIQN